MSEETAEAAKPGRGRPRPDKTIERDKVVLEWLAGAGEPKTRKDIAEGTNLPGNEVYLSIYRLKTATPPAIVKSGSKWAIAPVEEPAVA